MKENLLYLLISGFILGSGPCLSLCAPVLAGISFNIKQGFKKSLVSYAIFSLAKLISYLFLGFICFLGIKFLHNPHIARYTNVLNILLGLFIILIGLSVILMQNKPGNCLWLHKGNIRNVGILGLLIGLSPCLPLIGILNYIIMISNKPLDAIFFTFVFGLGTIFSPILLLIIFCSSFAERLIQNKKIKLGIRLLTGFFLIFLGLKIVLQRLFFV